MRIPNFIELQRTSFFDLLEKGILKELTLRNPISNDTKDIELTFFPNFYILYYPKISMKQAILKMKTYACRIYIPIQLINKKKNRINFQWILLCNFPLMTNRGHFIINGSPRVVINQIIRNPGIYYYEFQTKEKKRTFYADIISSKGAWIRIKTDKQEKCWAEMKKTSKIPIYFFLQSLGFNDDHIKHYITYSKYIFNSNLNEEENSTEQKKFSANFSSENKEFFLNQPFLFKKFMNSKFYDLTFFGRFQINNKLGLLISKKKTVLTPQDFFYGINYLLKLQNGIGEIDDIDHLKNKRIRPSGQIIQNYLSIAFLRLEKFIRENFKKSKKKFFLQNLLNSKPINGVLMEFFGTSALSQFMDQTNPLSEITHKRRLTVLGPGGVTKEAAGLNIRNIHSSHYGRICPIETPEGSSAGLVNSLTLFGKKNQIGSLQTVFYKVWKGQIQKKEIFFSADEEENFVIAPGDLLFSKLDFLPKQNIPVKQGKNFKKNEREKINLITISRYQMFSLGTSLIPFLEHNDGNRALMGSNMQRQALPLIQTEKPFVGTGLEKRILSDSGYNLSSKMSGYISYVSGKKLILHVFLKKKKKFKKNNFLFFLKKKNFILSPFLFFLCHFSVLKKQNRKMTKKKKKIGFFNFHFFSLFLLLKKKIFNKVKKLKKFKKNTFFLEKFHRSNQNTFLNTKSLRKEGDWVERGNLLSDNSTSEKGVFSLGKNLLVAYVPWNGYNFEDAVLVSEKLVFNNTLTSIHIERFDVEIRNTEFGFEKLTPKIAGIPFFEKIDLDNNGIVKIGQWKEEGEILIGKISPFLKKTIDVHERILFDILKKKEAKGRDTSLRVPKGIQGRIIHVELFFTKKSLVEKKEPPIKKIYVYIAEKRNIQKGDKISGRYGNKGIISKILPIQNMPFIPDGKPVDIVLNPLGVPSRMNVGQTFECILGLSGNYLQQHYRIAPFDEKFGSEASKSVVFSNLLIASLRTKKRWLFHPNFPGKVKIFDGCTGFPFSQYITIGQAYILKLIHIVDEKIHARSTGPYSLITQQPLRGRAKKGGQRVGEMEVWAIEAFGAAYILQEFLTLKSDDLIGRYQIVNGILRKHPIFLGIPESFKVLIYELRALCLKTIFIKEKK